MILLTVRKNAQITLPAKLRKQAHVEEGDLLEAEVRDDEIILRPKKVIDKSQAWFWTEEWQKKERRADEDIAAGRVKSFETVEELLADLHKDDDR